MSSPASDGYRQRHSLNKRRFFTAVGYTPHPGQEQLHGALGVRSVQTVIAACGARFGKTLAAAHELAYEALLPRAKTPINRDGEFMGWCVAPTHLLADIIFDTVHGILFKFLKGNVRMNKAEGVIEIRNFGGTRSRIMRRSTDQAAGKAKLVGYAVDFMILDEASGIDDSSWENQLRTRLIDRKGRVLMISTPRGVRGFFANTFRAAKNDSSIIAIRLPTWSNPYIDKARIEREYRQMDKKSADQEYGARFVAFAGLCFAPELVEELAICDFEQPFPTYAYHAGLDLAMTNDYTVLTVIAEVPNQPFRVAHVERFRKLDIDVQLERVKTIVDRYGCIPTVDAVGLGKPIVDRMQNMGIPVRPLSTTATGSHSKRAMVCNLLALLERRALALPRRDVCAEMLDELGIYEWKETPTGLLTASAPDGAHDDLVASLLLATHTIRAAGTEGDARVHFAQPGQGNALERVISLATVASPETVAHTSGWADDEPVVRPVPTMWRHPLLR